MSPSWHGGRLKMEILSRCWMLPTLGEVLPFFFFLTQRPVSSICPFVLISRIKDIDVLLNTFAVSAFCIYLGLQICCVTFYFPLWPYHSRLWYNCIALSLHFQNARGTWRCHCQPRGARSLQQKGERRWVSSHRTYSSSNQNAKKRYKTFVKLRLTSASFFRAHTHSSRHNWHNTFCINSIHHQIHTTYNSFCAEKVESFGGTSIGFY